MDTLTLLYITFIIYILIMVIGYLFRLNLLYMFAGLLWFIPMSEIDNSWIVLLSAIMVVFHFMIGLKHDKEDDFR